MFIFYFCFIFLKALGDEAVLHLKDFEKSKVAGRDLVDAKPDLQPQVTKVIGKEHL